MMAKLTRFFGVYLTPDGNYHNGICFNTHWGVLCECYEILLSYKLLYIIRVRDK